MVSKGVYCMFGVSGVLWGAVMSCDLVGTGVARELQQPLVPLGDSLL